jgi:hypothetical protein
VDDNHSNNTQTDSTERQRQAPLLAVSNLASWGLQAITHHVQFDKGHTLQARMSPGHSVKALMLVAVAMHFVL